MLALEGFFRELDRCWPEPPREKILLRIIGSTALMLQADYERVSKDSDVLETDLLSEYNKKCLIELSGPGTAIHQRFRLYLDLVPSALPFLPQVPLYHPLVDLNQSLRCFEIEALDILDVVVSKLKRFSPNDVSDIRAMADQGLVDPTGLVERFRLAVDAYSMDARADDLPRYVRNLHRVERDYLFVAETHIELPGWVTED